MDAEYVVVYLETMDADNENTSVADIRKIFENVETDYNHAVTENIIYMFENEAVRGGFKRTRTS